MKMIINLLLLAVMASSSGCFEPVSQNNTTSSEITTPAPSDTVKLPEPEIKGPISLEETLFERRSVRDYTEAPLSVKDVSQLLWAAQGITADWGGRTAPSAGGLYPLEVYVAVRSVSTLPPGVYKYRPDGHELQKIKEGDISSELYEAVLSQEWVKNGAIVIVIAAVYERTTQKYGDRGVRYVDIEVGHAGQSICLQATALNLGAVTIGAFYDDQVKNIIGMADPETPVYVIPIGNINVTTA
jgi:SagB-type dehydrogenase family enzyme